MGELLNAWIWNSSAHAKKLKKENLPQNIGGLVLFATCFFLFAKVCICSIMGTSPSSEW